jgi:hypothetical protein
VADLNSDQFYSVHTVHVQYPPAARSGGGGDSGWRKAHETSTKEEAEAHAARQRSARPDMPVKVTGPHKRKYED